MQGIGLIRVEPADPEALDFLELILRDTFQTDCRILPHSISAQPVFDSYRRQYHSTELLARLASFAHLHPGMKLLGVTSVDLYIPILTFVFGEAQLGGAAALLSTHRLSQEFYGLLPDNGLYLQRVEKEAVHELGHAFGLIHCQTSDCVMHFSNSVDMVDLKSRFFCPECWGRAFPDLREAEPPEY